MFEDMEEEVATKYRVDSGCGSEEGVVVVSVILFRSGLRARVGRWRSLWKRMSRHWDHANQERRMLAVSSVARKKFNMNEIPSWRKKLLI